MKDVGDERQRANRILWAVGKQLVIKFYDNRYDPPNTSLMRWDIMKETTSYQALKNQMPVPPPESRRIDWEMRDVPEYPSETASAGN